nr:MAG TPA: hypothetical protein [Caudoviricetes sp.]
MQVVFNTTCIFYFFQCYILYKCGGAGISDFCLNTICDISHGMLHIIICDMLHTRLHTAICDMSHTIGRLGHIQYVTLTGLIAAFPVETLRVWVIFYYITFSLQCQ